MLSTCKNVNRLDRRRGVCLGPCFGTRSDRYYCAYLWDFVKSKFDEEMGFASIIQRHIKRQQHGGELCQLLKDCFFFEVCFVLYIAILPK